MLRRTLSVVAHESTVLLSTHQTEDVAALCERVVVLAGGKVRFDGTVVDMVATAGGKVWLSDDAGGADTLSWRTGTGKHRVVGGARPPGAVPADPTLEDAYLLMLGPHATTEAPPLPA
jgi:ABC-2 type transport system ATP-binding protein